MVREEYWLVSAAGQVAVEIQRALACTYVDMNSNAAVDQQRPSVPMSCDPK